MTWRELNNQLRKATKVKPILQLYKAGREGKRPAVADVDLLSLQLSSTQERNESCGVS
jgi:hypothetical protein